MSDQHRDLGAVFDAHVRHEFEDKDVVGVEAVRWLGDRSGP